MKEVNKVITWFNDNRSLNAEIEFDNVGGTSYDIHGSAISEDAMKLARTLMQYYLELSVDLSGIMLSMKIDLRQVFFA